MPSSSRSRRKSRRRLSLPVTQPVASGFTRSQALFFRKVSLWLILKEYFLIGITGFGGGLQARFYHLAVTKHQWLDDEEYADVNASASLAPGGNASNMGLEIARRLRGTPGMIVAYLALLLPGSVIMIFLGEAYTAYQGNPALRGALQGLEAAAVALILYSATKLGLSTWKKADFVIAVACCAFMLGLRMPLWVAVPAMGFISLKIRQWSSRTAEPAKKEGTDGKAS